MRQGGSDDEEAAADFEYVYSWKRFWHRSTAMARSDLTRSEQIGHEVNEAKDY